MKKEYTKPVVELIECEAFRPFAASFSFGEGETDTMYSSEIRFDFEELGE